MCEGRCSRVCYQIRELLVCALLLSLLCGTAVHAEDTPPFRVALIQTAFGPSNTVLQAADIGLVASFNQQLNTSTEWVERDELPEVAKVTLRHLITQSLETRTGAHDVTFVPGGLTTELLGKRGLLEDLTPLYETIDLPPGLQASLHDVSGRFYSVPLAVLPYGVFYRRSVVEAHASELPTTLEGLLDLCDTLMQAGSPACFATPQEPGHRVDAWHVWFDSMMLGMFGPSTYEAWTRGAVAYTGDSSVEAVMVRLAELLERHVISSSIGLSAFNAGEIPFVLTSEVALAPSLSGDPDLGVFPFPKPSASVYPQCLLVSLFRLGVPSNAQHPDIGRRFAEFAVSAEGQHAFLAHAPMLPDALHPRSSSNHSSTPSSATAQALGRALEELWTSELSTDAIAGSRLVDAFSRLADTFFYGGADAAALPGIMASLEALRIADLFAVATDPAVSPPAGTYNHTVRVVLTTLAPNASVHYTLDGSAPSAGARRYTEPIVLSNDGFGTITVVLRCVSVSPNLHNSDTVRSEFRLLPSAASHAEPAPAPASTRAHPWVAIGLGISAGAVVLALCVVLVLMLVRARGRETVFRLADDGNYVIPFEDLQLLETVGRGGFGSVYRGLWCGVVVAVKQQLGSGSSNNSLHPNAGGADVSTPLELGSQAEAMRVRMFIREAAVMVRLRHPYVVTMLGICVEPTLCLVTEFMERGSLFSILQGPIEIDVTLKQQWALQIAQGLAFLHGLEPPILHRDLKSLNVLVDRQWVPKLADFGLSSLTADDDTLMRNASSGDLRSPRMARSKAMAHRYAAARALKSVMGHQGVREGGTVNWTAPEVLLDVSNYTAASDVYSYAILVWEIATRAIPFEGRTPMHVAMRVVHQMLRPSLDDVPGDCGRLSNIMEMCWAALPSERVAMPQVVDILRSVQGDAARVVLPRQGPTDTDQEHVVLVSLSLSKAVSHMLEVAPHAYSVYFRGLHDLCEAHLDEYTGAIWYASAACLRLAFPRASSAMAFIGMLLRTRVQPRSTSLLRELAGITQCPLPTEPAVVPCAVVVASGLASLVAATQTYTGRVARILEAAEAATPLGAVSLPVENTEALGADRVPVLSVSPSFEESVLVAHADSRTRPEEVFLTLYQWCADPVASTWGRVCTTPIIVQPRATASQGDYRGGTVWAYTGAPSSSMHGSGSMVGRAPMALDTSTNELWSTVSSAFSRSRNNVSRSVLPSAGVSSGVAGDRSMTDRHLSASLDEQHESDDEERWGPGGAGSESEQHELNTSQGSSGYGAKPSASFAASGWVVSSDVIAQRTNKCRRCKERWGCLFHSQLYVSDQISLLLRRLVQQPTTFEKIMSFAEVVSTISLFSHPNLLPVRHLSLDRGNLLLVVDCVKPGGLNTLLRSSQGGRLRSNSRLSATIVTGLLSGLVYLERMGLMYGGNLKASKVLVHKTGHVFLTDWGLHHLTDHGVTMTAPQDVMYMAPECLNGTPASIQSDVYAFGCIVLELYSTEPLFARNLSGLQLAMAISEGTRPTIPSSIPPHVSALVSACFAEPESRPSFVDLKEMWRGIESIPPASNNRSISVTSPDL